MVDSDHSDRNEQVVKLKVKLMVQMTIKLIIKMMVKMMVKLILKHGGGKEPQGVQVRGDYTCIVLIV